MAERTPTIHKKDMIVNKDKLKEILDRRGIEYIQLWEQVCDRFGLDLSYKGFMSLMSNRSTWKLLYAHAIVEVLMIHYNEIFDLVDIDVEKEKKKKEKWKIKYQR